MRTLRIALVLTALFLTTSGAADAQDTEVELGKDSIVVKGPEGTTRVTGVDTSNLGTTAGNAVGQVSKQASEFGKAVAKAHGVKPAAELQGEFVSKPGEYMLTIGRDDGTTASFASVSDVGILVGQAYSEFGNSMSFTGKVKFKTSSGEVRTEAGAVSMVRADD